MDTSAMISTYPRFEPLKLTHKPLLDQLFRADPPIISEYTFTNLFTWRRLYGTSLSRRGEGVLLRSDAAALPRFFPPLGFSDVRRTIVDVLNEQGGCFARVPAQTAALLQRDTRVRVVADPDNSDYVYRVEDLVRLAGKKYDGKRNLIRQFSGAHPFVYRRIGAQDLTELAAFEEEWCAVKACAQVLGLTHEREAIHEMIRYFSSWQLIAGLIESEGKTRAIALAEPLTADTMVMHVLKADPSLPGAYQVMLNRFLAEHAARFVWVNLEQDLGIDGLRRAKRGYHPARMVDKYTISLSA